MKKKSGDLALGLALILFAATGLGTFLFLFRGSAGPGRDLTIHFPHEGGLAPLKVGAPVLLGGSLQVGEVRAVRIDRARTNPAVPEAQTVFTVHAAIRQDLALYADCQITTDQPAVGGGGFVVILDVGTPGRELDGPVIGLPPQSLAASISALSRRVLAPGGMIDRLDMELNRDIEGSLLWKLSQSLSDVNGMTAELRTQLSPAERDALLGKLHTLLDEFAVMSAQISRELDRADGGGIMAKVHVALDHLGAALGEARGLLADNRPRVGDILATLDRALRNIDDSIVRALAAELDAANPASTISKVRLALDTTNVALADLRGVAATGAQLVTLNRPTIQRAFENLKDASEQLRLGTVELRAAPWRLLYTPTAADRDRLGVFETARSFAEAAAYLNDAAGRLHALQSLATDRAADPAELEAIRAALKASFERFQTAEKTLYDKLR